MKTKSLIFVSALLASACASHQGKPTAAVAQRPVNTNVSLRSDVVYTPANWPQKLAADVYSPPGNGPFPAVLMVHGGGWTGRTRADMSGISREVAQRGFVVVNVSYRLAPQARFPAQLQDLQQALLYMRSHAAELHIKPDRIAAWGYSAGAHLAALAALTGPGDALFLKGAHVQALVAGGTPVDVRYYPDGKLTNALMGESFSANSKLWQQASPISLVSKDDPPVFLYHGSLDFTVGVRNARAMYDALKAAGVPSELYVLRGLEHATTFFADRPVDHGVRFLDRYLR